MPNRTLKVWQLVWHFREEWRFCQTVIPESNDSKPAEPERDDSKPAEPELDGPEPDEPEISNPPGLCLQNPGRPAPDSVSADLKPRPRILSGRPVMETNTLGLSEENFVYKRRKKRKK